MCKSNEGHLLPVEIVGKTEVWTEIAQLQDRRQTGCAVKRWWSTAGVKPARELVRSTR